MYIYIYVYIFTGLQDTLGYRSMLNACSFTKTHSFPTCVISQPMDNITLVTLQLKA